MRQDIVTLNLFCLSFSQARSQIFHWYTSLALDSTPESCFLPFVHPHSYLVKSETWEKEQPQMQVWKDWPAIVPATSCDEPEVTQSQFHRSVQGLPLGHGNLVHSHPNLSWCCSPNLWEYLDVHLLIDPLISHSDVDRCPHGNHVWLITVGSDCENCSNAKGTFTPKVFISKTRGSCPELASTGQCYSIHSKGPPVECFHRAITVSTACHTSIALSQYPQYLVFP